MSLKENIFLVDDEEKFNDLSIEVFRYQFATNKTYRAFVEALKVVPQKVNSYLDIPFLPVTFFKFFDIRCGENPAALTFLSSGTTGMERSRHHVMDPSIYVRSLTEGFRHAYGDPSGYSFLCLVPTREENPTSSLGYMLDHLSTLSGSPDRKDYLHDFESLNEELVSLTASGKKVVLFGLTSALLDFGEAYQPRCRNLVVIETGGMKGKRKEMVREELHHQLRKLFGIEEIHSEYGMTELLSQAYSNGKGLFTSPPWMRILIRDTNDPLSWLEEGKTGGISIIDLANLQSCSFIATQDLGKMHADNSFEVLGRFDSSDLRGCNLMVM
jgi:hypothetical protein